MYHFFSYQHDMEQDHRWSMGHGPPHRLQLEERLIDKDQLLGLHLARERLPCDAELFALTVTYAVAFLTTDPSTFGSLCPTPPAENAPVRTDIARVSDADIQEGPSEQQARGHVAGLPYKRIDCEGSRRRHRSQGSSLHQVACGIQVVDGLAGERRDPF